jgi:hypothetical protein
VVSAGQLALVPLHASATSQLPAAARHTVPAATFTSAGQLADVPEHVSATSQLPAAARHTVALVANVHDDVQHGPPSHCSPGSTTPSPQTGAQWAHPHTDRSVMVQVKQMLKQLDLSQNMPVPHRPQSVTVHDAGVSHLHAAAIRSVASCTASTPAITQMQRIHASPRRVSFERDVMPSTLDLATMSLRRISAYFCTRGRAVGVFRCISAIRAAR